MAKRFEFRNGAVKDTPKHYYIAYGSNLNVAQMRMRCPHAAILGTACLTGWERGQRKKSMQTP